MNLLQHETSPYLLQHAHNPVHWMPWGEEAFAKAILENKPVLVSIGYSSCHWCHVMEHESFENQETADLMNSLYINIKVDREEYPDVDHMYMDAVQAMTGSGGWPLNVFLTPDKKPFYGGTYFPPQRAFNRASWKETLINVSQYFSQNRDEVEKQALQLTNHLKNAAQIGEMPNESERIDNSVPSFDSDKAAQKIVAQADAVHGGFGNAPKFPSTFSINYLLDHYLLSRNENSLQQALLSLDKMAMGGIYDHVGGGFARYSTDTFWIAPHFEKMLYDNALLIEVYAKAFYITKKEQYKTIIYEIIAWLKREMTIEEERGIGFYSAQDADSEGVEGKYYTWSYDELKSLLKEDFDEFVHYFSVKKDGNWEHTNILYTTYENIEASSPVFKEKMDALKAIILKERVKRIKPLTDDKILLSWNALINKALSNAALLLGDRELVTLAEKNMQFLLHKFESTEHLFFHTYKDGVAKIPAFADDLAYLADALIKLTNVTGNTGYLLKAKEIVDYLYKHFLQKESVLFDYTNHAFQRVEVNKKDIYDGATPSPNAVICSVLLKLGHYFQSIEWQQQAEYMLGYMQTHAKNHPTSFGIWASMWQNKSFDEMEVTIIGNEATNHLFLLHVNKYLPTHTYLVSTHQSDTIKSLENQYQQGVTKIIVCEGQACHQPIINIETAIELFFKIIF